MRIVWSVLIVAATGCADAEKSVSKPRVRVDPHGEVQQGIFSADGKAFLASVTPIGKDPAAERQKPRPWVLWSTADGTEIARWTGNPIEGFKVPGTSDGTSWPVHLSEPPKLNGRNRLLDLTTGITHDIPGVHGPTESCTFPSYSADRTRLAYSDYAKDDKRRTGRVFEKTATGWNRVAEVPGQYAVLSLDGKLVATVAGLTSKQDSKWSLVVRLFTVADGKELWATKLDSYGLHGFTPDGRYVIQLDNAGHRLFDVTTGKQAVLVSTGGRLARNGPDEVAYRDGWVTAVIRSGDSAELVRWNVAAGKEVSRTKIDSPYGRNRTPPFSSPRLAVVLKIPKEPAPDRRDNTRSSTVVDVFDPAVSEAVERLSFGDPGTVIVSPDGNTLATFWSRGISFYTLR